MAIGMSSIFTPGFSTSKPGDMKNTSGILDANMYGIAAKNHRSMATAPMNEQVRRRLAVELEQKNKAVFEWPEIKAEPRTEFDVDLTRKAAVNWGDFVMPAVTPKDFNDQYGVRINDDGIVTGFGALAGSTTNGTAGATPTFTAESIEKMKLDIAKYAHRAPVVNRDTPESAPSDAW